MILGNLADKMKNVRAEELAVKTGLSVETIRNAKSGKSVTRSTATAIANALKIKVADLETIAESDKPEATL